MRLDGSDRRARRLSFIGRLVPDSARHKPLYGAIGAGVAVLIASLLVTPSHAVGLGANTMFIVYLVSIGHKFPRLTAAFLRERAREADAPALGIILVVLATVAACVVSLFIAVNGAAPDPWAISLSVVSVVLGWFAIHTLAAMHYAFEYYQPNLNADIEAGLQFPDHDQPDGVAFIYFSYTLGAAVATSDVKVASNAMRGMVVLHTTFSFFFNTVLLASAVNVVLSVGGGP